RAPRRDGDRRRAIWRRQRLAHDQRLRHLSPLAPPLSARHDKEHGARLRAAGAATGRHRARPPRTPPARVASMAGGRGEVLLVAYAASNALAKQIEAGAPADVFISADVDWMDYLDQRRLLAPNTRVTLLRNALVLIAPAASNANVKVAPGFGLAAALGKGRLAI